MILAPECRGLGFDASCCQLGLDDATFIPGGETSTTDQPVSILGGWTTKFRKRLPGDRQH
jgi:hypothetical protein